MKQHIEISTPVQLTPRVRQMAGLFDVPLAEKLALSWDHELPLEDRPWNIGLITGPSGAGKTLLANTLWPQQVVTSYDWPDDKAVLDGFPPGMGVRQVTELLSAVGFGSPPAWMRPYRTLSNGEAFRATIARALAESGDLVVVDEFTSVVDRQVAKVASHTVQKAVRGAGRQLVAVTCHYDVLEWLQPDWAYQVEAGQFTWRSKRPRPSIPFAIHRCDRALWRMFARYHYLNARLHTDAKCFAAYVDGRPVAFNAYTHFPHPRTKTIQMAHRLVVLPDWQGLGIAGKFADWTGQYLYERGFRYRFVIAHPGLIHHFARSPRWRASGQQARNLNTKTRDKGMRGRQIDPRRLGTRAFEYVPPVAGIDTGRLELFVVPVGGTTVAGRLAEPGHTVRREMLQRSAFHHDRLKPQDRRVHGQ